MILSATTEYVLAMMVPLLPPGGFGRITDAVTATELHITVFVTTANAKAKIIGHGGENIHAITHLARERQRRDNPALKVTIDVILGGGER